MLRFILKKLHIFILCFCLLHVQINLPLLSSSPTSSGQAIHKILSPASWIKISLNEAAAAEFKAQKIDTVDYISLITMIAVGIVAAGLIKSCGIKANYEVYIFAAGALVYILGEIAVNASYKDIKDKTIQYNDNGKLTNEQEKALKDLKKSYEDIKDITQIKQMLQLAAMTAFLTAAGIATAKWIKEKAALKACLTAIKTTITAMLPKCQVETPPNECGECIQEEAFKCNAALQKTMGEEALAEALKIAADPSPSAADVTKYSALIAQMDASVETACASCMQQLTAEKPICTTHHINSIANAVACIPGAVAQHKPAFYDSWLVSLGLKKKAPPQINSQIFERLFSTFIPKAYADGMGAMLGIGAAGLGILAGLLIPKSLWVDKLIPFPGRRAILFAACGALALTTSLLTSNIRKKAQSNIDKINKILNQYKSYDTATTSDGDDITSGVGVSRSGQNIYGKGINFAGGKKLDCLATTSSGACANYNDLINNAKQEYEESDKSEVEGLSIDPSLMSATNALGDGINGVQGNNKLSGETLGKFAQVAASQGAARTFLDNVRKKLNEVLKDNDEDEIDFAAQEQQTVKEMQDGVAADLKKNGINLADEVQKGNLGPAYQQELKDAKQSNAPIQTLASPLSFSSDKKKKSYKVRDLPVGVYQGGEMTPVAKDKFNGEDEEATINSENGPSLWEIIKHRYHNFWPKFLPSKKSK